MSKKIVAAVICLVSCVAQATGPEWFLETSKPSTPAEMMRANVAGRKPIPEYMAVIAAKPEVTTASMSRPSSSLGAAPTSPSRLNQTGFTLTPSDTK